MHFLVDSHKKIVFGWSAKCGCSHVKTVFYFLTSGDKSPKIHSSKDSNALPINIQEYTTIIVSRNPYERLVSGFLDKYKPNGEFRHLWKSYPLTFSNFVNALLKNDWKHTELHHFTPQLSERFDERILSSKILKVFDIKDIDYAYIEELFEKQIPETIIQKRFGHERNSQNLESDSFVKPIYDAPMVEYVNQKVAFKCFYNERIRKLVYDFYRKDFEFFKAQGIEYSI